MEKRTPHCDLATVRRLIAEGKVQATLSAERTGRQLGFNFDDMVAVVLTLTVKDFYKSMTTYADHTVWQDVYRPSTRSAEIYLKLTVIDEVLIVSFKEL